MFRKIGIPKMLATQTAIFRNSFKEHLSLAATVYYLSVLNQNL